MVEIPAGWLPRYFMHLMVEEKIIVREFECKPTEGLESEMG